MVGNDVFSNIMFIGYREEYDGAFFNKKTINGEFIYKCYYDYVEKCYCACIECIDCLKNECKILFNKFNIITCELEKFGRYSCVNFNSCRDEVLYLLENGYDYDEDIAARTPILVEMELFTGDYIKKIVSASYIIKMLNYKGG